LVCRVPLRRTRSERFAIRARHNGGVWPDDADLVARFAVGDELAVKAMYERFARPVLTVAMSALGRRDLADEVVQTTMLKAWRAAGTFDPSRELAPWIYAIARRVAIDVHRRESRAPVPSEVADDVAVEPLSFSRTWEAWEVRLAVDQLPADERDVVRLSHLVGLTHREIADRLGVPLGTVKSRSSRAHRRLASLLGHVVEVTK
jgi:RNA polymerase sigma factor (sigma-70 family)